MGGSTRDMITVDIDSKDIPTLTETYHKALSYGKTRVTETTKGYHLRIRNKIRDPLEIIRIRRILGDDPKRIEHDLILIELGHPELANRLFKWKRQLGSKEFVKEKPFDVRKLNGGENE
jgi:hypothetical protein